MKKLIDNSYAFDDKGIAIANREIYDTLLEYGVPEREVLLCTLALEEVLTFYQEKQTDRAPFSVLLTKALSSFRLQFRIPGAKLPPLDEDSVILDRLIEGRAGKPVWSYAKGINTVQFQLNKKAPPFFLILLLIMVGALGLGLLVRNFASEETGSFLTYNIIKPVSNTVLGVLSAFITPMILVSVWQSIYSLENLKAFNRLGKATIRNCILSNFLFAPVAGGVMMLFLTLSGPARGIGGLFSQILNEVLNIFPRNLLSPFIEGNTLQAAFIGLVLGGFTLLLGDVASPLKKVLDSICALFRSITSKLGILTCPIIFCALFSLGTTVNMKSFGGIIKWLPIEIGGCLLGVALTMAVLLIRFRNKGGRLIRMLLPAATLALMTDSSAAALPTMFKTFANDVPVEKSLANFHIPIGHVFGKPGTMVDLIASVFCAATVSGMEVDAMWAVSALIMACLMAIAAPPVPGGGLLILTTMCTQLAIPEDGLNAVLAIMPLMGYFATSCNVFVQEAVLCITADRMGKLDRSAL